MPRRCLALQFLAVLAVLAVAFAPAALAQPNPFGDYGDAPEGAIAYPGTGQMGSFPTCYLFGGGGYVAHGRNSPCWLGLGVDDENEGNQNLCPAFGYEADECFGPLDFDAGIVGAVTTYTILAGVETPCDPNATGTPLGGTCTSVAWGGAIDVVITNNAGTELVINVLADWDGDGRWAGVMSCGATGLAEEHVLQNWIVPIGYVGLLSGLAPPPIRVGPRVGFAWMRITLSEGPGPLVPWDGSGDFDLGETEDYLVRIVQGPGGPGDDAYEFGDAPEDAVAYPDGTVGKFPTCLDAAGSAGYVLHGPDSLLWLGRAKDYELDGNAGTCPPPGYDEDECDNALLPDAGLLMPQPFTLDAAFAPTTCPSGNAGTALGVACGPARWGAHLDIEVSNLGAADAYLQVLADWNRDGAWDGTQSTCSGGVTAGEQVLLDFVIPAGYQGALSALGPPDFEVPADPGLAWFRFTLTEAPVGADWFGDGDFAGGETEDYLLFVGLDPIGVAPIAVDPAGGIALTALAANPFRDAAQVALTLPRAGTVTVRVVDLAGRVVARLGEGPRAAGRHVLTWNGRRDDGRAAPPGIYFVEARAGAEGARLKLTRLR